MSSGSAISDFFNVNWDELEVAPEGIDFNLGNDGFDPTLNFNDPAPAAELSSLFTDPAAGAEAETTGTQDQNADFFADVPGYAPVSDIFTQAQVEPAGVPGKVYPEALPNNTSACAYPAAPRASSSHRVGEVAVDPTLGPVDVAGADSIFSDLFNELFEDNTADDGPRQDVSNGKVSNTQGPSASSLQSTASQKQFRQGLGADLDSRLTSQPFNPIYGMVQGSTTQALPALSGTQPQFGPDLAANYYGSFLFEQPFNSTGAIAQGTTTQALPASSNTQPQFGPDLAANFGSSLFERPFNPTNFIEQGSAQASSTLPTAATATQPQFRFNPIADLDSSLLNQPFNLREAMSQGSTQAPSALPAHATSQGQFDLNSAADPGAGCFLSLPSNPTGMPTQGVTVDPRLVMPYSMPAVQPAQIDPGLIDPAILAQWETSQPANPAAVTQAHPTTAVRNQAAPEKPPPPQIDPGLVDWATFDQRETSQPANPQTATPANPTIEAINRALAKKPSPPPVRCLARASPGRMPANPTAPAAAPASAAPWHPMPAPESSWRQGALTATPSATNPPAAQAAPLPCRSAGHPKTVGPNQARRRKMLVHARGKRKTVASDVYQPLDAVPESWGPSQKPKLFSYTEDGEWDPYLRLSKIDILWYITNARRLAKRPLTIWIQHLPPQHNYRYPHEYSSKCRWSGCPASNNTILKGFYRVAFDERPHESGSTTDPFHNAGYMHLHCFEKIFDAVELVNYGLLTIDDRVFPYEDRNPMAVVKDDDLELARTFASWREEQGTLYEEFEKARNAGDVRGRIIPTEQKLWWVLTQRALEMEGRGRARVRIERQGNSVDKHMGDLDKYVRLGWRSRAMNKAAKKRVAAEITGDSSDEEDGSIVKRAWGGGCAANPPPSPALSHITVDSSGDETPERGAARQAQAGSPGADWLSRRKRKRVATEQEDGEYVDAGFKIPWDADLRGTRRSSLRLREKVRRCASL